MNMQQTSVDNQCYNLISVMYHTLQGCQTYSTYINDAQQSGDQQLAQFFQQLQQQDNQRAQMAQQMLAQRLGQRQMNASGVGTGGMGQTGLGSTTTR
jgi:rubrerythrin